MPFKTKIRRRRLFVWANGSILFFTPTLWKGCGNCDILNIAKKNVLAFSGEKRKLGCHGVRNRQLTNFKDISIIHLIMGLSSLHLSNLFLRLGLAAVFIWFGVDKFLHPEYWLSAWIPQNFISLASKAGVSGMDVVYVSGVFELLVGASILSNIFIKIFSVLALVFLVVILLTFGISEVLIRDIGLMGGFLSLLFWPERQRFL